ncbi:MAG: hypothetical protein QXW37_08445 [Candidatus Nitrosotenuis sp.]
MKTSRVTISLDTELLNDIYFDLMKIHGTIEPKKSLGEYIYKKLRNSVPHRNIQV